MQHIKTIVPNTIWHAQQVINFGPFKIQTRATFVKLADGSIWVHSPIKPTKELLSELEGIGTIRHVIAPNKSHYLFFHGFIEHFPNAKGYIAEGLPSKRPDLQKYTTITENVAQKWSPDLIGFQIKGIPLLNETAWFHEKSGTLIVTDLMFSFSSQSNFLEKIISSVLGVNNKMRMSRTMKLLVKDKNALKETFEKIKALPVKRVVLAHDSIVEKDVQLEIQKATEWLY